ncbi:hypothetical protein NKR23_g4291 [Pleurostoma richardsiae]|uniref:2EXR domain-containing protein n=1 Tax=Pleurostoma richardsiae TaxID=41990 RepID=A0AA38RVH4_9PEZI|nr:hypothetical protein NKR23_g4291 [Pleurostoma richardsiae]
MPNSKSVKKVKAKKPTAAKMKGSQRIAREIKAMKLAATKIVAMRPKGKRAKPGNFILFPHLPEELQLMVWEEAAKTACPPASVFRFTLSISPRPSGRGSVLNFSPLKEVESLTRDRRALLATSRNARKVMLRRFGSTMFDIPYTPACGVSRKTMRLPFNPMTDVFCLDGTLGEIYHNLVFIATSNQIGLLKMVHNFGISVRDDGMDMIGRMIYDRARDLLNDDVKKALGKLPVLRRFFFVVPQLLTAARLRVTKKRDLYLDRSLQELDIVDTFDPDEDLDDDQEEPEPPRLFSDIVTGWCDWVDGPREDFPPQGFRSVYDRELLRGVRVLARIYRAVHEFPEKNRATPAWEYRLAHHVEYGVLVRMREPAGRIKAYEG